MSSKAQERRTVGRRLNQRSHSLTMKTIML